MMKNKDILLVLSIMLIFAFSVLAVAVDSIIITDFAGAEKLRNSPINYGASFRMNVTCSSCADNVTVLINSTSDGTGITVILNVTNAGEGIFRTIMNKSVDETLSVYHAFTNHINLSTSGSYNGTSGDANYSIKVSDNAHKIETITVYFNFSNPGSVVSDTIIMQQTGVAYWFNSGTGVGYYNSTYTDDDDTGSVIWNYFNMGVNDSGRDLNPSVIDNVTINVTTSSGANIQMCLNESGVSTGIFNVQTPCAHYSEDPADYPFNLNSISSDSQNKLKVVSGDNLNLTYIADVDFDGSTVDASDKIWMDTLGEISDPGNNINPNSTASTLVQIYDNGTNTDYETVQSNIGFATLYSYTVNWELIDTVTVGLNESVADSSALDFNATIYANTGITSETWADTSTLHVATQEGGYINITYNDTTNFSGEYIGNANTIGPIQIDIFDTGVLSFNYSGSAIGTGFSFLFKVNDSDINTDSTVEQASVIISSTRCMATETGGGETDGSFATFFLNESNEAGDTTETDSAVFGIPVGRTDTTTSSKKALTFTFAGNTTHSCFSNDTHIGINATANDKIYVNYSDQFPTADYQLTSWMEETGTTTITNGAGASSSTFNATDYVYFNISDAGRNTNNATIQCVTVVVNSTSDTDGITIGINETGADTGIFANDTVISCSSRTRMPLQLSTSSAEATNKLLVAAGSTVQVMYDDNRNAAGANPAVNVSSTFNVQSTGTISIDASRYHINNDVVVITVTDKDNKTQTNITGVSFSSNMNHTGIYITLNRTDSTNGVFNVTVDKTSEVGRSIVLNQSNMSATGCLTGDYHINVSTAGWVMANYTDASTGNIISTGKIRLASDATPLTINATATAFIPANTVGINITVTDMANNTDVTAQDTIDIMVNTTTNSTTRFIQATETTADSGIFELILDTSTSAQDADTVLVSSSNIEEYIKFW